MELLLVMKELSKLDKTLLRIQSTTVATIQAGPTVERGYTTVCLSVLDCF